MSTISLVEGAVLPYKGGRLLDLGCWKGDHAIMFAQNGMKVVAVDKSEDDVNELILKAMDLNLKIDTIINDITVMNFDDIGAFDVISCINVLHYIDHAEALRVIGEMKNHTRNKGINIVAAFTPQGSLSGMNFFSRGELKSLYLDWDILKFVEFSAKTYFTDEEGVPKMHEVSMIIARKK